MTDLPMGWRASRDQRTGRVYFLNDVLKTTQWTDPRPLPPGWEERVDPGSQRHYFACHATKTTQWEDPRPPLNIPLFGQAPVQRALTAVQYAQPAQPAQPARSSNSGPSVHASSPSIQQAYGQLAPATFHQNVALVSQPLPEQEGEGMSPEQHSDKDREWYKSILVMAMSDKAISQEEHELLQQIRKKWNITDQDHIKILSEVGLTVDQYEEMRKKGQESIKSPAAAQKSGGDATKECVVCIDATATYIIIPCMHICLCENCSKTVKLTSCPKCRAPIQQISKTY